MKIGEYKLYTIDCGTLSLDGGAMFGIVPKTVWVKTNPADEKNRIFLSMRSLLLISDNRKILIDTGAGNKNDEKFKSFMSLNDSLSVMFDSLKALNVNPNDITDVILTHLHYDHSGGATIIVNDKLEPTFPNAKYYVQKTQFEWAQNPSEKDKAAYFKENFMPLMENNVLEIIDGNFQLFENVELIKVDGHTPGQQIARIFDEEKELVFCADLIPLSSQLHVPYIMGYDLKPLVTLEEKKKLLTDAFENKWSLFFEHDPYVECGTISKNEKGYFTLGESIKI